MAKPLDFNALFDADFLARMQRFSLRLEQAQKGGRLAEQKTRARGQGLEFADFKPYAAGDDLRAIDWHIYRRMGRLFVRVFEEQQDLPVYFLVDQSDSLFLEQPPRINSALRCVLALSAITLSQHDSVGLFSFAETLQTQLRSVSGKTNLIRLAKMLCQCQPQGQTALASSLRQLADLPLRSGLVVLVSDFFEPEGIAPVFEALARLRHKLLLVQLVRQRDADPSLDPHISGELCIEDCESGQQTQLTISNQILAKYQQLYRDFDRQIDTSARELGALRIKIDTDQELLGQLTALFEAGGLKL